MLADEMFKARMLEEALKKSGERLRKMAGSGTGGKERGVLGASGMPLPSYSPFEPLIPTTRGE